MKTKLKKIAALVMFVSGIVGFVYFKTNEGSILNYGTSHNGAAVDIFANDSFYLRNPDSFFNTKPSFNQLKKYDTAVFEFSKNYSMRYNLSGYTPLPYYSTIPDYKNSWGFDTTKIERLYAGKEKVIFLSGIDSSDLIMFRKTLYAMTSKSARMVEPSLIIDQSTFKGLEKKISYKAKRKKKKK